MQTLIHSNAGLVHVIAAIGAMLVGTLVVIIQKGTRTHRMLGYLYFYSMLILNGTAFLLYGLLGTFGPFHVAALVSLATLLLGFIPVFRRKPKNKWLIRHFTFMYYSVVGLYAAFASETLTRIPETLFYTMVSIASVGITLIGVIIYIRFRPRWAASLK